jgi:sulfate transport system permease protein
VLPGFGLTLGFAVVYLSLIALIPMAALFLRSRGLGWSGFWETVTEPRVLAACRLSFGAAFLAATINAVFGFIVAWTLVRYRFFGRRFIDALIDLPFALPTAVAGIALDRPVCAKMAGSAACWSPWASRWPSRRWASGGAGVHRPALRGAHGAAHPRRPGHRV